MSAGPRVNRGRRVDPNIQKQLEYHVLARTAALEGLKLAAAGDREGALAKQREAAKWEKEWRRYGGKGPLT